MQLSILAIGKMKSGPETDLLSKYLDRSQKAGKQLGLSGPTLQEWTEAKSANAEQRKLDEGELITASLKPGGLLFCLDERGKDLSSLEFSQTIQKAMDNGSPQLAFALGGPDGHSDRFRSNADHVIRFGKATWPHQMARIMLSEQIYRAITILSGHPYHRT